MTLAFELIDPELQEKYLERLAACPVKTSDCSFVNLWGWSREYGLRWAWEQNLVWILQTAPDTVSWPPVGDWEAVGDWRETLAGTGAEKLRFVRVPERLVDIWEKAPGIRVSRKEDRAQWDYLYDAADLLELKGKRFHKKKNLLNQFRKKYDYEYIGFGKEMIERVLAMQTDWCEWRDCELNDALAAENRVIEKVLESWNKLKNICGGALAVDGKIVAYTLGEMLSEKVLLIHFEKGDPSFQGTYQAINQMFVEHALQETHNRIKRVNRMQDLGDEGLRKAKLSYNPSDFVRKCTVEVRLV